MVFTGNTAPEQFRVVTRAHLVSWSRDLEQRSLAGATIRRKLAALSSLFEYLCEANSVNSNPVKGLKRPKMTSNEGKTPAIGDHQARSLLSAPDTTTVQGLRDRAIVAGSVLEGVPVIVLFGPLARIRPCCEVTLNGPQSAAFFSRSRKWAWASSELS